MLLILEFSSSYFFWLVILFLFVQVIDILLKMIYVLVLFARFVSQCRPRDILKRVLIIYDYICACKIFLKAFSLGF